MCNISLQLVPVMPLDQVAYNVLIPPEHVLVTLATKIQIATVLAVVILTIQKAQLVIRPQVNVLAKMVLLELLVPLWQVRFYNTFQRDILISLLFPDPTYTVTCTLTGPDLSSSINGKCTLINFNTGAPSEITIPNGQSSATSDRIYEDGSYLITAEIFVGATKYTGNGGVNSISGANIAVTIGVS